MISSLVFGFISLALSASRVAATGGFPADISPSGSCAPLFPADASCAAIVKSCFNTLQNTNDPYSNEACVAAASCFPQNPDAFLVSLHCRFSGPHGFALQSASIPRVPDVIVNKIVDGTGVITFASYSKWYNGLVAAADSNVIPLVDPAFVKMSYDIILAWTGLCSSGQIPKSNFVDWFQWFSTVTGPATTCNLVPNCPLSNYPYVMDLTVKCAQDPNAINNPFGITTCVSAALNWQDGVDSFLQALTCRHNLITGASQATPVSNNLPALSFNLPVANLPPYTQQNFIDFTYGSVSALGTSAARFPAVVDPVIHRWSIILAWTNFCSAGAVPQPNLSDFLKYSHGILSTTCA